MLIMKIKHILIIALVSVSLSSLVAMENLLNAQADNEQVLKVISQQMRDLMQDISNSQKKIMQMITVGKENGVPSSTLEQFLFAAITEDLRQIITDHKEIMGSCPRSAAITAHYGMFALNASVLIRASDLVSVD